MGEARNRKLPVVASFGPVAASGGYWVGAGADTIFASPSTVTGSIGVFGIIPTFEGTLGKLGISADGVTTTPPAEIAACLQNGVTLEVPLSDGEEIQLITYNASTASVAPCCGCASCLTVR